MIYENFTKRRAKVMIFDSAGNTRSGFAKTNEKQKIETMKKKKHEQPKPKTKSMAKAQSDHKQTNALHYFRKNINLS